MVRVNSTSLLLFFHNLVMGFPHNLNQSVSQSIKENLYSATSRSLPTQRRSRPRLSDTEQSSEADGIENRPRLGGALLLFYARILSVFNTSINRFLRYKMLLKFLKAIGSVRIVQKEVGGRNFSLGMGVERRGGGRNFSLGGGLRDEVEVDIFFDKGLKKRWGSNFIISYRRKR